MPIVQHMVLIRFKPETASAAIDAAFAQLRDLQTRIPGITYFAGGPYNSSEGLNAGYTHGFLMTFSDPAARDAYLSHPEHERVKQAVLPLVDAVIAFDFDA
jgi:hypothetical protein